METTGLILFRSAAWLTGFALLFLLVLRNERFFKINRLYLLFGMIASLIFPFFAFHYEVVVTPAVQSSSVGDLIPGGLVQEDKPLLPFYAWIYLTGILLFLSRMLYQTGKILRHLKRTGYERSGAVKLVRTTEFLSTFSFFSFVFVNPSIEKSEMEEIMNHEREHIRQKHWLDLLLVEIVCIVQWFNPFAWVYAHLVRQNHEFLADEMALQQTADPAIYRAALLNQLLGAPVFSLTNSFSYSTNKQRFKMMKKKIDSPMRKLKLLVVLPLMAMLFYAFAVPDYRYDQMATVADPQGKGIDVKGEVRKQNGDPLPGTSIILKGSTIGTISDPKGAFALKGIPSDGELFFSYVGYKTKVQKVTGKTMNITLVADTVHLDGAKDDHVAILPPPPPPPPPPLPQDGTVIFKKGDSKNPPLIIFDGKVIPNEEMQQIKPDSIASISILKEKSATAVYGDKGKNGVILITSKRAEGVRMDKGGSYSKEKVVTDANGKEVFMVVEEMPEYPGGEMALRKFLAEQIRYPVSAQEKHIQGKVFITFVVNAEGNVEKAKIARGVDPILDAEALRVVGLLKGWKPGKQKGQPVSVAYTIPVTFALDNGKKVESASGTSKKEEVVVVGYGPSDKAEKKSATDPKEVFVVVEEMPEYPGGQNALIDYLVKNLKYPEEAKKAGITGKVFVTFVVNAEGKVENAKIARSASPSLDAEALRLVGQMPDWKPGKQRGVAVSVAYTLPISFALK